MEMKILGVIDGIFAGKLALMVNFRSRLVHLYWDLDKEMIYQFVQENLDDFKMFEKRVVEYLSKQKP